MKTGSESTKIKPIPWPLRKTVPLVIGNKYFFCFGGSYKVQSCILIDIIEEDGWPLRVVVEPEKRSVYFQYHTLYADEIALTEIGAIENEVTL
jgi:hypothetical protein